MKYTVSWLPSAAKDLKEIRDFLDEHAPEQAQEIVSALYEEAEGLIFMPTRWKQDDEKPAYRRLIVLKRYKIFFRINQEIIEIHYIRHTARSNADLQN